MYKRSLQIPSELSQFSVLCPKLSQYSDLCPKLSFLDLCPKLSQFSDLCPNLHKFKFYAQNFYSFLIYAQNYHKFAQNFRKLFWSMPSSMPKTFTLFRSMRILLFLCGCSRWLSILLPCQKKEKSLPKNH